MATANRLALLDVACRDQVWPLSAELMIRPSSPTATTYFPSCETATPFRLASGNPCARSHVEPLLELAIVPCWPTTHRPSLDSAAALSAVSLVRFCCRQVW